MLLNELRGGAFALLVVAAVCNVSACVSTQLTQMERISFETDEGTWMSVDVSPDGDTIVFDLLGDLYLMPAQGGEAVALTTGLSWDSGPRFAPNGAHVFFISDRMGYRNLWKVSLADQSVQQITRLDRDIWQGINWSNDGRYLLAGVAGLDFYPSAETLLHYVHPVSGAIKAVEPWSGPSADMSSGGYRKLRGRKAIYSAVGAAKGRLLFSEAGLEEVEPGRWQQRVRIFELDPETRARIQRTPDKVGYSEFKPLLSHSGHLLAYYRQYDNRRTELRLSDLTSKQDRLVTVLYDAEDAAYSPLYDHRPNYAFMPDDSALVFWHAGKIQRVSVADGESEIVPFRVHVKRNVAVRAKAREQAINAVEQAKTIQWPSLSRDGKTMVFAAVGYIWVMDIPGGDIRRLTASDDYEFMPAISPDGSSVAYVSFSSSWGEYKQKPNSQESGRLMVANIEGQMSREIASEPDTQFALPAWSEDGTMIATLRSSIDDGALKVTIGWVAASNGYFNETAAIPKRFTWGQGRYHYSQWVGFDRTGENLLFSYPVSPDKTILAMADLAGEGFRELAIGTSDVGGIAAHPDLSQLVLTRRGGTLWLLPFEVEAEPKAVSTLIPEADRLSENGGYHPVWLNDQELSYGFGTKVYRYNLNTRSRHIRNVSLPITRPTHDKPIAFKGARLITLSEGNQLERVIENGVLLVAHGRIQAVGLEDGVSVPDDAAIIDVAGKTIAPGFIDTHYHNMGGTPSANLPNSLFRDSSAIEYGVTTAWDPGSKVDDGGAAHADLHTAGRVIGPRWSFASDTVGFPYELQANHESALATVERAKDLSVTVLKEYNAYTRAQQQNLSAAARHHGLGIVSHLDGFDTVMTRIADGYTGGDHPYIPVPFYNDVQQLLVETGFIWTPNIEIVGTTISTGGIGLKTASVPTYFCEAVAASDEQGTLAGSKAGSFCEMVVSHESLPSFELHRVGRVARQAALAASNGASIGVSAHDRPAYNLHMEMWALWRGGMPAEEVLRSTSLVNAEKLGLQDELGSLEAGKAADFLVLDGNPMDDILNTMSLRYTIQGGVIYDADNAERITVAELQSRLAAEAAANDDDALFGKTETAY